MYCGQMTMKQSSISAFYFPAVISLRGEGTTNQQCILIRRAFSYEPSWTSVMLRHVKQCFDFCNIWVWAGPSSNLTAVWLPYQTPLFNYSEILNQSPLFLCLNWDKIKITLPFVVVDSQSSMGECDCRFFLRLHQRNTQQWILSLHRL